MNVKTIKRAVATGGIAAAALGGMSALAPAAQAATKCEGSSYSGRCVEVISTTLNTTVVESVPLSNNSQSTVTASCSFGQTVSRSIEVGTSATVAASGTILGAVEASVSATVSASVSQTATQATTAAGSATLAPGQSVTCQRTYGSVTAQVRQYDYSGSGTSNEKTYTVTVPSTLGANFV